MNTVSYLVHWGRDIWFFLSVLASLFCKVVNSKLSLLLQNERCKNVTDRITKSKKLPDNKQKRFLCSIKTQTGWIKILGQCMNEELKGCMWIIRSCVLCFLVRYFCDCVHWMNMGKEPSKEPVISHHQWVCWVYGQENGKSGWIDTRLGGIWNFRGMCYSVGVGERSAHMSAENILL